MKWLFRLVAVGALTFVTYGIWDYWRGGFFSLPDLPDGATPMSFATGLRAILLVPVNEEQRRYLGRAADVPKWFEDSWSTCTSPTEAELESIGDTGPGSRLEAVCYIEADGDRIFRGAIFTIPRV
ncbi:MAG: hypothetical protein MUE83_18040 [Tabrizicola sp.]|jgi:hypothetical protein|nr:hypothetical protein [Tabrizicola sp.]